MQPAPVWLSAPPPMIGCPIGLPGRHAVSFGDMIYVMDKIAMLTEILAQNPGDAFARYGLAMEHANQGQTDASLAEFDRLLSTHPDYTAGYFMAAQTLVKAGRTDAAKARLEQGIASAQRTGNQHAQSEMEALLEELA